MFDTLLLMQSAAFEEMICVRPSIIHVVKFSFSYVAYDMSFVVIALTLPSIDMCPTLNVSTCLSMFHAVTDTCACLHFFLNVYVLCMRFLHNFHVSLNTQCSTSTLRTTENFESIAVARRSQHCRTLVGAYLPTLGK